jgi:hypothetical protein
VRRLVVVLVLVSLAGCVRVRPWQRGDLSRRSMTTGLGDAGLDGAYRAKVLETMTGGGAAGTAPGGGCGCSQ